ncbi:hypothetical protein GCM10010317_085840 [Streptomyces mirabilis]|uniref:RES family NAD+ phosphorylase n=1 Tax=Streptomyces mirabilis TaxID=68239 RepID=UPI0019921445|nr:hypothetical protein GCM10010317_085840 [Streptomyces mirabilis]
MTQRDQGHQGPPDPNQDLSDFASRDIRHGSKVYRTHEQSPWYFASAPNAGKEHEGGRFDLPKPKGTLYVANNALSALAERLGPDLLDATPPELPSDAFDLWFVSSTRLPYDYRVADLWSQKVGGFGVIASEMSASAPYAITQEWASAWKRAGLNGVRYSPRHDAHRRAYSLALFGHAGDATADQRQWPITHAVPARTLLRNFSKAFQVEVLTIPSKAEADFTRSDRLTVWLKGPKETRAPGNEEDRGRVQERVLGLVRSLTMRTHVQVFRRRNG